MSNIGMGIDSFKTAGDDQGSNEKRMPYFTAKEGKTELVFLTDFNEKNGFPPLLIYRSYPATVQGRNGDYTRRFAYFEGDVMHPEHVEKKEAEGKNPERAVSNRVLAVVFNKTLYEAYQKSQSGTKLKKIEKAYLDILKEGDDPTGPFIWDAGAHVIKGIRNFIEEQQEEDENNPSLFDFVFELQRQGTDFNDTQYVLSPDDEYDELDDEVKEHLASLKDREEFKAPSELVEYKRYKPPENSDAPLDDKFSIANLSPQQTAPSNQQNASSGGSEDDEW